MRKRAARTANFVSESSSASGRDLPDRYLRFSDKVERQRVEAEKLFKPPESMPYEEFHERLWLDEELWQGIRERYESDPDEYPALSELLFDMSDKEIENFSGSGPCNGGRRSSSLRSQASC